MTPCLLHPPGSAYTWCPYCYSPGLWLLVGLVLGWLLCRAGVG